MGCGKTLTAIAIAGAAYQMGAIKTVLIVAPTSVCSVWPKEFEQYADFPYQVNVLLGNKKKRLKEFETLKTFPSDRLKTAVINYESCWREDVFDSLINWKPDLIIADESQRIKTHDARQSKALHALGDVARYKLILSGTPVQNEAIDLYSQYRFLNPEIFGKNYYNFRNRYAVMGGFEGKKVIAYKNMDELIRKEHSIAYRITKAEALDLPEQTFLTRHIKLGAKELQLYDKVCRESVAELESGGTITAPILLTKMLRLQQLTGGFLQEDGEPEPKFIFKGKLDALEDILEDYVIEGRKKLVVFCRFRSEINIIQHLLEKKTIQYRSIYGEIKSKDRGTIVKDFQTNPEVMVFLAQIDTAGLGITLTAADTCVYYSTNFNYAAYSQSLARIHRIGQRNTCCYIHLIAEKTIDETIMAALAKKEDLAKLVVDDWKRIFKEKNE